MFNYHFMSNYSFNVKLSISCPIIIFMYNYSFIVPFMSIHYVQLFFSCPIIPINVYPLCAILYFLSNYPFHVQLSTSCSVIHFMFYYSSSCSIIHLMSNYPFHVQLFISCLIIHLMSNYPFHVQLFIFVFNYSFILQFAFDVQLSIMFNYSFHV